MRTSKKDVQNLFDLVCNVYNLPTSAILRNQNPNQEFYYSNEFYKLDYASCYGGYSFRKVEKGTGEDFAFGTGMGRMKPVEAACFLRGMLAAKNI
jgi:hypothetical protein